MSEPCSLFSYWDRKSGYQIEVNPDPPSTAEAKPFHVVIEEEHWIPVSILVFARDEGHARSRVKSALSICLKKNPKSFMADHGRRYLAVLAGKEDPKGSLVATIKPLGVGMICANVNWASNGGLL